MQTPLRKMRIEKGITITQVARATKIDVGNLSRIERGIQLTSLKNAEKIAKFFNGKITEMQVLYPHKYTQLTDSAA
ncbi:transcriptional regulator [Sodalis sp. TME1]|nr:transcriptional regulator [Sodalis sp. TME1]